MATNTDCLFCKIASGTIPVTRLYEDEQVLAFPDLHPQAPVHILVIPKQHFASLAHTDAEDAGTLGHLLSAAATIARQQNLTNGYRLVVNTGPDGGQTVDHLHVHLLGGRHMGWPPG
jgi:histidine triad (HIT) family protein